MTRPWAAAGQNWGLSVLRDWDGPSLKRRLDFRVALQRRQRLVRDLVACPCRRHFRDLGAWELGHIWAAAQRSEVANSVPRLDSRISLSELRFKIVWWLWRLARFYAEVMNEHATVVRVERHEPAAGRRDEVAGVLKSVAEAARDASGCFGAQVASSDGDPNQVVLISRWESSDAMRKFHARPDFTSLEQTLDGSVKGTPSVEVLTTA